MEQQDRTSKSRNYLVVLIVISIVLNLFVLRQISRMGDQIDQVRNQMYSRQIDLTSSIYQLQRQVDAVLASKAWYTQPTVDVVGVADETSDLTVRLTWTFHELAKDSDVGFQYRLRDGNWEEAPVQFAGDLDYQATVEVPMTQAIAFHFSYVPSRPGSVGEAWSMHEGGASLEYRIYAEDAQSYRAGEIRTLNLEKMGGTWAGNIRETEAGVEYEGEMIVREMPWDMPGISAVDLLAYRHGRIIQEAPLAENDAWRGTLILGEAVSIDQVGFRVTLADGTEFERNISVSVR